MRRPRCVAVPMMAVFAAVCLASVVVAVVGPSAAAVPARSPSAPVAAGSSFVPIDPHQSDSYLKGVSCPTATFCMAVGFFEDQNSPQPLAERFNGTTWTNADAKLLPDNNAQLEAVSCTSSSFCMAVGDGSNSAIAQEWNGHSWSSIATDSHATDSDLNGVSCPADDLCEAVGQYYATNNYAAMVQYWTGGAFTLGTAAEITGAATDLSSVSCPSTSYCLAVGNYQGTGPTSLLAEKYAAGTWSLVSPTITNASYSALDGVSCTGTTACMAVGFAESGGGTRDLSYSWDGTSWLRLTLPQHGTAIDALDAVSCGGSGDAHCVAAGHETDQPVTSDQADLFDWDGTRWAGDRAPAAVAPYELLSGVSCSSASRCVAVGTEADTVTTVALALSRATTTWVNDSVPNPRRVSAMLQAVSCVGTTQCVAVGGYDGPSTPLAEVWNGSSWKVDDPSAIGEYASLSAVSCPTVDHCVAVGQVDLDRYTLPPVDEAASAGDLGARVSGPAAPDLSLEGTEGLVETWNGSRWASKLLANSLGASETLTAVWCRGASFCMAVGTEDNSMPDAWVWRGRSWSEVGMPATADSDVPEAVRCPTTTECITVGSAGYGAAGFIERWNGERWTPMTPAGAAYPYFSFDGLACPSTNRCYAVGTQDVVYDEVYNLIESWNGTKWTRMTSPAPAGYYGGLSAVSCAAPAACLASGPTFDQSATTGLVLRWNGTTWSTVTLPTAAHGEVNLLGVYVSSPTSAVVVGWKYIGFGFAPFTLVESDGHWRVG